jgi:predicted hydrolase (HD superfamily)
MIPTRDEAIKILNEMVKNDNLKQHMYCVEACMRAYARKYGEDEEKWGITGLLHDADWEKFPEQHPKEIVKQLRDSNVDEDIAHAIASHGDDGEEYGFGRFEKRESLLDKALFACDELAGFIIAVARVRPNGLDDLKSKSVKKKLKDKAFAAQVSRDDIENGAKELGIELNDHIEFMINALKEIQNDLKI